MKYSPRIWKKVIFLVFIANHFQFCVDGRHYDKCETPDGRQGVCVVKRYCRERITQPLLPCDNDDSFCCPIPTSLRSAQSSSTFVTEAPQNFDHPKTLQPIDVPRQYKPNNNRDIYIDSSDAYVPDDPPKIPENSRPQEKQYERRPVISYDSSVEQSIPQIHENRERTSNSGRPRNNEQFDEHTDIIEPKGRIKFEDSILPVKEDSLTYSENRPRKDLPLEPSDGLRRPTYSSEPKKEILEVHSIEVSRDEKHEKILPLDHNDNTRIPTNLPKPRQDVLEDHSYVSSVERPQRILPLEPNYDNKRPMNPPNPRREVPNHAVRDSNEENPRVIASNDDLRKSQNQPVIREDSRRDRTPSDKSTTENHDRNRDHSTTPPPVLRYPSRDQFETQKLPSNPRRLKPLRYDSNNDTDENFSREHVFSSHDTSFSQPKVPACGVKPYDLFIAGGETSEAYEWPWMTSIFRRHQGSRPKTFLCGGSLINTKYVLTAAHCFVNNYVILPASSFVVRLGSHYLDSGEEFTVANLVIHSNHSGSDFFNDIALVRIASEVYITDKIAPICLPTLNMMSDDLVDRLATVAGWGDTQFRTGGSRALQHVTVPIVSSEECFSAYSRVRGAAFLARGSDHVICAGLREGGKDACLGDSGGPLMLKTIDDRWTIVGIVSLGYKCAEPGYPGVYTRVTHYLSWIQSNMKAH